MLVRKQKSEDELKQLDDVIISRYEYQEMYRIVRKTYQEVFGEETKKQILFKLHIGSGRSLSIGDKVSLTQIKKQLPHISHEEFKYFAELKYVDILFWFESNVSLKKSNEFNFKLLENLQNNLVDFSFSINDYYLNQKNLSHITVTKKGYDVNKDMYYYTEGERDELFSYH